MSTARAGSALAALGALLQPARRRAWLTAGVGAFVAHAAAVVIKRVVRRERPAPPGDRGQRRHAEPAELPVGARHVHHRGRDAARPGAPGCRCPSLLVPPMALSRLVLGVHYPSDVLTGVAVGAVGRQGGRQDQRALGADRDEVQRA